MFMNKKDERKRKELAEKIAESKNRKMLNVELMRILAAMTDDNGLKAICQAEYVIDRLQELTIERDGNDDALKQIRAATRDYAAAINAILREFHIEEIEVI